MRPATDAEAACACRTDAPSGRNANNPPAPDAAMPSAWAVRPASSPNSTQADAHAPNGPTAPVEWNPRARMPASAARPTRDATSYPATAARRNRRPELPRLQARAIAAGNVIAERCRPDAKRWESFEILRRGHGVRCTRPHRRCCCAAAARAATSGRRRRRAALPAPAAATSDLAPARPEARKSRKQSPASFATRSGTPESARSRTVRARCVVRGRYSGCVMCVVRGPDLPFTRTTRRTSSCDNRVAAPLRSSMRDHPRIPARRFERKLRTPHHHVSCHHPRQSRRNRHRRPAPARGCPGDPTRRVPAPTSASPTSTMMTA